MESKTSSSKTWVNFIAEFHTAQKELCRAGELTIEDSVDHNELVNMVSEGIQLSLQQGPSLHQDTTNLATENNETREK
eukprot:11122526-Ditylum_brightwellii.AAC.1